MSMRDLVGIKGSLVMNNNAINRDSVNSEERQTEWAARFDIFSETRNRNRNRIVAHLEHSVWYVRWGKKVIISLFVPRIKVANEKECGAESSGAVSDEIKNLVCTSGSKFLRKTERWMSDDIMRVLPERGKIEQNFENGDETHLLSSHFLLLVTSCWLSQ